VERTSDRVFMPLTVGGGIRGLDNIRALLRAGADKVSINSAAVDNPDMIKKAALRFGTQCIVVAIDAKKSGDSWELYIHGGRTPTGIDAVEWAVKMRDFGAGEILLTSMDRDGTRVGYDIELTKTICDCVDIPVIASGGVGTLEHFYEGFAKTGVDAALAASIFHFGEHTVGEVKRYLAQKGIKVRL